MTNVMDPWTSTTYITNPRHLLTSLRVWCRWIPQRPRQWWRIFTPGQSTQWPWRLRTWQGGVPPVQRSRSRPSLSVCGVHRNGTSELFIYYIQYPVSKSIMETSHEIVTKHYIHLQFPFFVTIAKLFWLSESKIFKMFKYLVWVFVN